MAPRTQPGPSYLNSAYGHRYPIAVTVSGAAAGPHEVSIALPNDWDTFWDNVLDTTNGWDIVVTTDDGTTVPTFDLASFNHSTRTGTIRASGVVWAGGTIDLGVLWIYWGRSGAPDMTGAPTTASPKTGRIHLTGLTPTEIVVPYQATNRITIEKDPIEDVYVWFDVGSQLAYRITAYQKRRGGEGIETIDVDVTDDGASQAMTSATTARIIIDDQNRLLVGMEVYGGTTGSVYQAEVTINTTEGRELLFTARVVVTTRAE